MSGRIVNVGFLVDAGTDDPAVLRGYLARKYGAAAILPVPLVLPTLHFLRGRKRFQDGMRLGSSEVITSSTGSQARVHFRAVLYTPGEMMKLQPMEAVIRAAERLERDGCEGLGLGAFTSIVGKKGGGIEVAGALNIGVTTGNALTVYSALEGLLEGARQVGHHPAACSLAIIGATGSIGSVVAPLAKGKVCEILLVGRDVGDSRLRDLADAIGPGCRPTTLEEALCLSDLVVTVTNETQGLLIDPRLPRPGAVFNDVARPRNTGRQLAEARPDTLQLDGGLYGLYGEPDLGFNFGLPRGVALACMTETILLALEGRVADKIVGPVSLRHVLDMSQLVEKHGVVNAGLRFNDRPVPEERIRFVRGVVRSRCL
jgi:predicted amino acid dehydrogenase